MGVCTLEAPRRGASNEPLRRFLFFFFYFLFFFYFFFVRKWEDIGSFWMKNSALFGLMYLTVYMCKIHFQ